MGITRKSEVFALQTGRAAAGETKVKHHISLCESHVNFLSHEQLKKRIFDHLIQNSTEEELEWIEVYETEKLRKILRGICREEEEGRCS